MKNLKNQILDISGFSFDENDRKADFVNVII